MGHAPSAGVVRSALFRAIAAATFTFTVSTLALAYTPTVSSSGVQVRWEGLNPKLNLVGNSINANGISADSVRAAVVRSIQRWALASLDSVTFDYWQGDDDEVYVPNSEYNGTSSIYFASHSNGAAGAGIDASMIGLTQVWYNATTGQILEVDTVLNDISFQFTTNPSDTTGFGSESRSSGAQRKVYIENVMTHELGHSLGLSHSGSLQATMLFMEAPEQARLSCDDQAGIRALYPAESLAQRTGAITGKVLSPTGRAVFGAHVHAISRQRGTVLASSVTASDGSYTIGSLE
ncbi:MAG: matrixin family metalloprotease, partial [Bdellovibrionota bacterium]